jgi:hypothetical protein
MLSTDSSTSTATIVICDEIAMESGILRSSIHCVLTEGLQNIKVTAYFMTMQDLTLHEQFGLFLPFTNGKHCLTLLIILISVSSQS